MTRHIHPGRAVFVPALALLGTMAAGCDGTSDQSRYEAAMSDADAATSVRMEYYPPLSPRFLFETESEPETVRQVVEWLKGARLDGALPDRLDGQWHASPTISIEVGEQQVAYIEPMMDCRYDEGGGSYCRSHPRHVLVRVETDVWRVAAPVLASWMHALSTANAECPRLASPPERTGSCNTNAAPPR